MTRAILSAALAATLIAGPAVAASYVVNQAEDQQAFLIRKFPVLRKVDQVIRNDCAAKNPPKSVNSAFCRCASAVTMTTWASGVDPNMPPRIQAFIDHPSTDGSEFLAYQGPELYEPLCRNA